MIWTTSQVAGQESLSGFWAFRVNMGGSNVRETYFELKQRGAAVTGRIGADGEQAIRQGTFRNGTLRFLVRLPDDENSFVVFKGRPEDGKIVMTQLTPGRAPLRGVAIRVKPMAALPPPRLALPALREVPDNGLARTPPMGWNSWNFFAEKIDDKTVREIADAMVSTGMAEAGYTYINIDDTWAGSRDANGNLHGNAKFPDMKALADYVHAKGLKLGIYSSPGPRTCAGYQGSYGHELQDARTFASWGIDYLKYDWCSASDLYADSEMQAVYQKMGDALQKTGRPIVYSLCQYGRAEVWKWGAKTGANLWRTTGDIADRWKSIEEIGFSQLDIAVYSKPGQWNDPDMLEIGNGGMSADEYRTQMSLWAILSAPLLAGNDLRSMSTEIRDILTNREIIEIDQDRQAAPPHRIGRNGQVEIWVRKLGDNTMAVAFLNHGNEATSVTATWEDLGVGPGQPHVRDLWNHKDAAVAGDTYTAKIPSHGVVMLRISPGH